MPFLITIKSLLQRKTFLYCIAIGALSLCGITICMLLPYKSKKTIKKQIKKIQATFLKKKLLRQLNHQPLLLENSPFNFPQLPQDLQLKIFAGISPRYKNQLQKTCISLHENGSKQPPYIWKLVDYPLNIAEKDVSEIILKAVVYEKANVLEKILQNHKKRDFIYEYTDSIDQVKNFYHIY